MNRPALHAAADARGGTPTDQVLASIREWQRQRALSPTRLMVGLSVIALGLAQIERGKVDAGAHSARLGFEFLRNNGVTT